MSQRWPYEFYEKNHNVGFMKSMTDVTMLTCGFYEYKQIHTNETEKN